jgi:hypothetical protein
MNLTPEIEEKGMRAYERVQAFARVRTWRLPLSYVFFALFPALTGVAFWVKECPGLATMNFLAAILFVVVGWLHWKRLVARNALDVEFLAELKRVHGAALPWVEVENHFAELERLKVEGRE